MAPHMIRQVGLVSLVVAGLVGCAEHEAPNTSEATRQVQQDLPLSPTLSSNALTGNALTGNALTGNALTGNALTGNALTGNALTGNALTGNALTGNALTGNALTGNGVTDGQAAREVLRYVYSCAMPAGKRLTLTLDGQEYHFDGAIGLAPEWGEEGGTCGQSCQRWISACLLARTNAFGVPVPISIRGNHPALANVSQAEKDRFSFREGSYYGNVFDLVEGRHGCTGPASNEPALTERLCSNGGTEGGEASPCKIEVAEECFIPESERFIDPLFGENPFECAPALGTNGEALLCDLESEAQPPDPYDPVAEVITVYLEKPQSLCGNGVCETGESHLTCGDCSRGWAKLVADPVFVDPTAGLAVDPTNNEFVIAGMVSGGAPDFGGGPRAGSSGGLFLARYDTNGGHVSSSRIGAGDVTPIALAIDSAGSVFVAGRYRGDGANVGGIGFASTTHGGFVAKYSASGGFLWSTTVPFIAHRMVLDSGGNPVVAGKADAATRFTRISGVTGVVGPVAERQGAEEINEYVTGLAVDASGRVMISDAHGTSLFSASNVILWTQPGQSGNVVVDNTTGHFYLANDGSVQGWKYTSAAATLLWTKPIVMLTIPSLTRSLDKFRNLVPTIALGADGNLVVGGVFSLYFSIDRFSFTTTSSFIFEKSFVAKLAATDGRALWAQQLASPVSSTISGLALDRGGDILLAGRFQANVVIDGFSLSSLRQTFRANASELFLAKVRDQIVNQQPNDRAGGAVAIANNGDGLTVEYFDDINLTLRRGSSIADHPDVFEVPKLIENHTYSIRWTGVIESDVTGDVTFELASRDGVRLYIDDTLVIDNWTEHDDFGVKDVGTFPMVANQRHRFRLEYFNVDGDGFLSLSWRTGDQKIEPIRRQSFSSAATRVFTGTTAGLTDDYQASCGGGARGADAVYKLRVEEPTRLKLAATGGFAPVLHLRDGSTTAGEVACSATGAVDVTVGPGAYLVVVDGQAGASGAYQLTAALEAPRSNDLDANATFVSDTARGGRFYGSTTGYADNHTGSCGGAGQPDAVYRVVLTAPRQLRATTDGSDFDTVLYVTSANGTERACNDDVNGTKQSAVDLTLPAGTHFIHVDGKGGGSGVYRVDVNLSAPRNQPPTADAGADQTATCVLPGASVDFVLDGSASSDPDNDALSFLWAEGATPIATTESANVSLSVGTHVIDLTVDDGFFTASDRLGISVIADTAAPVFGLTPTPSAFATSATGAVVSYPTPSASDDCDVTLDVSCSPVSGSQFPLGATTVTCSTRDDAGNEATTTFVGKVIVSASSLLSPINADGSSVFKKNSTIPLKFVLTGPSAGIADLTARVLIAKVSNQVIGDDVEVVSTSTASTGNLFRYDALSGQYLFNLGTKGLSVGTYQIRIDLGDGVSRTVLVSIN
jgi:hypothetical protein